MAYAFGQNLGLCAFKWKRTLTYASHNNGITCVYLEEGGEDKKWDMILIIYAVDLDSSGWLQIVGCNFSMDGRRDKGIDWVLMVAVAECYDNSAYPHIHVQSDCTIRTYGIVCVCVCVWSFANISTPQIRRT